MISSESSPPNFLVSMASIIVFTECTWSRFLSPRSHSSERRDSGLLQQQLLESMVSLHTHAKGRVPPLHEALSRKAAFLYAEPLCHAGPDIGEPFANAEVARSGADGEERDALAGMVRAFERRVVAVVCGDDEEVIVGQRVEKLRQTVVEAAYVPGHALGVAAVAVLGVE